MVPSVHPLRPHPRSPYGRVAPTYPRPGAESRRVASRSLPTGRACAVADACDGAGGEWRGGGGLGRPIR
eukprot:scaffold16914_cov53-Phaeocystis_antarctica.AAC.5